MTHKTKRIALALATAFMLMLLTACFGGGGVDPPIVDPPTSPPPVPEFYRNLSGLLSNEKNSHYFGEIELTVGSQDMYVDGEKQIISSAPEYNEGRLMLPITAIAKTAGAEVSGNISSASGMTIKSAYGDVIRLSSNSDTLSINGAASIMDATPYGKAGEAYMSANSIASALNLKWDFDDATSSVTITAPYQTSRILVMAGDDLGEELKPNQRLGGLEVEGTPLNDGTGMWILQFASPEKAKAGLALLEVNGYQAEPDYYLAKDPLEVSSNDIEINVSPRTWGYEKCGYGAFADAYSNVAASAVVAVVDSGVDVTHPFLNGRIINGIDLIDGDFTPPDGNSHGTHVAGTIIDCARNADVRILPVRALDDEGTGSTSSVVEGIKYAANNRADVINLSLGGRRNPESSNAEEAAINYAISKGSLIVIAAGNSNEDTATFSPAYMKIPGTVIVAAGDKDQRKADFSNYGESVDLMAPGVDIVASVPNGEYQSKDGTSMATPHVSAAAALLDLATGKTLSPAALEGVLLTATTHGRWTDPETGYGFLDLSQAEISPRPNPVNRTNVLMSDHSTASDDESAKTYPVFGSQYQRQQITSVTFLPNLRDVGQDAWDVSEAQDNSVMAWVDSNELYIAGSGGVTAPTDCGYLFYGYSNLKEINFSNAFHTDSVTDMSGMFYKCASLTEVDLSSLNTRYVSNMAYMFCGCENLTSVNLDGLNTSSVSNMSWMFSDCTNLSHADLSGFDTSNVTDMFFMFNHTLALKSLDVSHFNTANVTNMGWMFNVCGAEALDVGGFDTSNVTSMACMFSYTPAAELDVSGFKTSNVTDMRSMFVGAENLQRLDVSGFDTSQVTDIRWMFFECKNLRELDISGFDFSKVIYRDKFAEGCPALEYLDTPTITPVWGTAGFENEGYENLFDGNVNTKWCLRFPEGDSAKAVWKMSRPGVINWLHLTTGNDNSRYPGRNPGSWVLWGYNDEDVLDTGGTVWHSLGDISETGYGDFDGAVYSVYFAADNEPYQYYVLEVKSTTGADTLQLSEVSLDYR